MMRLSQNQLKLIAALSMTIDHIGVSLFPRLEILRIIGRLAFPVFAYFIFEGFRYTHSRGRYFLRLFVLGLACMAVYYFAEKEVYGNILITFSLSVAALCAAEYAKTSESIKGWAAFGLCMAGIYALCRLMYIDYGFFGVMAPVCAYLAGGEHNKSAVAGFGLGICAVSAAAGGIQYFSLFALIILSFYDGNRGKMKLGQFFYWFYPVHLGIIGLISYLI